MKNIQFILLIISLFILTTSSIAQNFSTSFDEPFAMLEEEATYYNTNNNPSHFSTDLLAKDTILFADSFFPIKEDVFCWRETYGRGVGTVPTICPDGMEYQAGLCYTLCKDGFYGVGPVCWQACPAGFRDDGAYCGKPDSYGRGAGYPWEVGDPLNDSGQFRRCENDNGKGNCEKYGLIVYPKCKTNFHNAGCCVCSPDCPSGWTDIGVSCAKPSYGRGAGVPPTACTGGKEYQAGLCYTACKDNFRGVGPVCWEIACPNVEGTQWVDCGAGCAKTTENCATSVIDMVTTPLISVLSIAGMVVTAGGSGAISATAATTGKVLKYTKNAITTASTVSKIVIENDLIAAAEKQLNGQPMPESQRKGIEEYAAMAYDAARTYDFDWRDFTAVDPTGLASVAAAYANPLCKDVKGAGPGTLSGLLPPVFKKLSGKVDVISAVNDKIAWGVQDNGTIWRTNSGATNWQQVSGRLVTVSGVDYNIAWGTNGAGQIWRTNDGGVSWQQVQGVLKSVSAVDYNTAWGIQSSGAVFRTNDGGASWQQVSGNLSVVSAISYNIAWGTNSTDNIWRTSSGGANWQQVPGGLKTVSAANYNTAWGVQSSGAIYRTRNGGKNWEQIPGALKNVSTISYKSAWGTNNGDEIFNTSK